MTNRAFASPRLAEVLTVRLQHTYTRTPRVIGAVDAWNDPTSTDGTPVPGIECQFEVQERTRIDDNATVLVMTPTLYIASDDTLSQGDYVSDILDNYGNQLVDATFVVESIAEDAAFGPMMCKVATLRRGDPV